MIPLQKKKLKIIYNVLIVGTDEMDEYAHLIFFIMLTRSTNIQNKIDLKI